MVIRVHSDRAAFVFYDLTHAVLEEVPLNGLRRAQIETVLDDRGFYCEDASQFSDLPLALSDDVIAALSS